MKDLKDLFIKGFSLLSKSDSNYFGFALSDDYGNSKLGVCGSAKLDVHDRSHILNAYIHIQKGTSSKVWIVRNGHSESFPATLGLWFKGYKKLGLKIEYSAEEASYFLFGFKEHPFPDDSSICCIIENEDYALCLYVDNSSDRVIWLQEFKESSTSDLIEFLKHIPEIWKEETIKDDFIKNNSEF